jgi:hypothetical protein
MRHAQRLVPLMATVLGCALLAACSDEPAPAAVAAGQAGEPLPTPGAVSGSITGMPEPGSAPAPQPGVAVPPDPGTGDDAIIPLEAEPPSADLAAPAAAAPSVEAAVAVLRKYYAAINARDFATAESLWESGGRGGEGALAAFAGGFEGIAGVSVQLGAPGPLEAGPGSRYVTIPAIIEARHADGTLRRYGGSYTLRAPTEGAERGMWRISSAGLEERPR